MLGNCDNTTNQWPQNQIGVLDDHKAAGFMASSSSTNKVQVAMAAADHIPLKCPRCDSSNTKFCYYNNYSLSQPRHFCKACKRYWTRGGTLRNVPVGGGCRKNKRPKRHSSSATSQPPPQHVDLQSPPSNHPLFYALPTNPLDLSFPFSSFRVSSDHATGFDLHPPINGLGLGFEASNNTGFKPIQDGITNSSSPPFSTPANNSFFFGSSSSTMASLLASTLQQQKFGSKDTIPGLMPYEDPQMPGMGKQVKAEGENRLSWNPDPNPIDQINSSDPSSLLWNTTGIGAWFDPSSVPSLI